MVVVKVRFSVKSERRPSIDEKNDDEKEGVYFSICCCHCCHLFLSSGAGRGLSRTVAATLSREQRRRGGGGGGGGEREGGVGGGGEEEEDAVAAARSRGCCPTSPPTEGWILTLARRQTPTLAEERTRPDLAKCQIWKKGTILALRFLYRLNLVAFRHNHRTFMDLFSLILVKSLIHLAKVDISTVVSSV